MQTKRHLLVFIFMAVSIEVQAYWKLDYCASMKPKTKYSTKPQQMALPAILITSSACRGNVKSVGVSIIALAESFEGLVLQMREKGTEKIVEGTFTTMDSRQFHLESCLGGTQNTLIHTDLSDKETAKFIWETTDKWKEIEIVFTYIEKKPIYWLKHTAKVAPCRRGLGHLGPR